jgi:maltose alpha-D-glucosyltransferase/alpha-amylase
MKTRRILMTEVSKAFLQEHFNSSLLRYASSRRWYAHKAVKAKKLKILSAFSLDRSDTIRALVCEITFAGDEKALYFIPVEISETEDDNAIGSFVVNSERITLTDAFLSSRYAESLLHNFLLGAKIFDGDSYISFSATDSFTVPQNQEFRVIKSEQSNSSFIIGDSIIIKNYRNIKPGENPDIDVPEKLFAQGEFHETPAPMGDVAYYGRSGKIYLAYASRFIAGSEDAWSHYNWLFSDLLRRNTADHSFEEKFMVEFIKAADSLGRLTGRMHRALSSVGGLPFTPEEVNEKDITGVARQIREYLENARAMIEEREDIYTLGRMNFSSEKWSAPLEYAEDYLLSKLRESHAQKIRVHGDYHLGQILMAGGSYYVIDFEGEPMKDISERIRKYPPEKDIAGMIRSLDYLLQSVFKLNGVDGHEEFINITRVRAENVFVDAYRESVGHYRELLGSDPEFADMMLKMFVAEKSAYELVYELNNRPLWVKVPLNSVSRIFSEFKVK